MVAATVFFTLFVRLKDIPAPEPISPTRHLEERKAAIYENLRDLQFEYRVGKLSDEDYQQSKVGLQKELAGVIGEMDKITAAREGREAGGGEAVKEAAAKTPRRRKPPRSPSRWFVRTVARSL